MIISYELRDYTPTRNCKSKPDTVLKSHLRAKFYRSWIYARYIYNWLNKTLEECNIFLLRSQLT